MDWTTVLLFVVVVILCGGLGGWAMSRGEKKKSKALIRWGNIGLWLGPVVCFIAFVTAPPEVHAWSAGGPWRDHNLENHYNFFLTVAWTLGFLWLLVWAFLHIGKK